MSKSPSASEWRRSTRFFGSVRIAMSREAQLWRSPEIKAGALVQLEVQLGKGRYRATALEHGNTMDDADMLGGMVLVYSYAIAEAAAHDVLRLTTQRQIEHWGRALLKRCGRAWADVTGGKGGCVHAAVVRNVLAHGGRRYDARAIGRLADAGVDGPKLHDEIALDVEAIQRHRTSLKSLLRVGRVAGFSGQPL